LKALPTVDWPALRRLEGNRRFLATLRADRGSFDSLVALAAKPLVPSGLARFAPLGLVLESFVREEELFSRGKNKLGPTIHALDDLIPIFHAELPRSKNCSACAPQTRAKARCESVASLVTVPNSFILVRVWPSSEPAFEPKLA